jgi:hypothetical protein
MGRGAILDTIDIGPSIAEDDVIAWWDLVLRAILGDLHKGTSSIILLTT